MLDIALIRDNPQLVEQKLARRGYEADFSQFLERDRQRRELIHQTEQLKAERNRTSSDIPRLKKSGDDISGLLKRMKEIGEEIKAGDEQLAQLEKIQKDFLDSLPNLPADDIAAGDKENNEVIRIVGEKPQFAFDPVHHVDLVERLGIIDYVRGAKLGGSGFWLYKGEGALLEWALLNFFISEHLADGYQMILPPHILNWQCGYTAGQFPKFADDVYQLRNEDSESFSHFILPTAETALVNLYRDEIIDESTLPAKFFAYTPCYRKEAGSYRAEERGMIRGHQFNKIELFQYTLPEQSETALDELVAKAASLVEKLGLHFRVSRLAAGDCSASMTKTYDIEVWIPSMQDYKEVSSASNAGDYQARRGNMKYRNTVSGKLEYVHTLNASGLATSRIFPAIIEQYQQQDGSVLIPEVLRPWMGGREKIGG